jgi:hypothetical protein
LELILAKNSLTFGLSYGKYSCRIREVSLWFSEVEILHPLVAQIKYAACSTPSLSLVADDVFIQANCEYIMKHRIDTDSPEFSFMPKFGRAVQNLWAEEIIPVLLDHPSRLPVDDNVA